MRTKVYELVLLLNAILIQFSQCTILSDDDLFFNKQFQTSFDYLAFKDDRVDLQNGNEYKFIVDTDKLDKSNKTRRDISDLFKNMKILDSDPYEPEQKKRFLFQNSNIQSEFEQDKAAGLCSYSNIRSKMNECFQKSDQCSVILDCITSFNLVELCKQKNMYTPTVWILNVYQILKNEDFCSIPVQCDLMQNENEYLRRLDNVLKSMNEYGPAYLNQPKVDNKKYCSKSNNLIARIRDAFDIFDMCFEINSMNKIKDLIEDTADNILDRNCHYCISANLYFDECLGEKYDRFDNFNIFACNESIKCIEEKIENYNCNTDSDVTPLKLITSFINNMSMICEPFPKDKNNSLELVREWYLGLDLCLKERHFMGLTFNEAPPNIDLCHEIDETFNCLRNNYHNFVEGIPILKPHFDTFAKEYNRLLRSCDVYSLSKFTPTPMNSVTRHTFQNNSEQTVLEDDKNYYHQTVIRAEIDQMINWINIDSPQFAQYQIKKDHDLSKNYLKATIVKLKFKFPYYGHLLDQIVVATGGFLYVGSLMNPLITKAQYIAPLMANFDPTLNNRSLIKYVDNSTHFICTWENLLLQDQQENGEYTFQVVLSNQGQIVFNYKKVPTLNISSANHTVKVGLSDAYIFYRLLSTSKIEYTIVQYHVVNVLLENVKTGNSILFFMIPNCLQFKSCDTCIRGTNNFKCIWCPVLNRCSDTVDRYRQEWIEFSCPMNYELQSNLTCYNAKSMSSGSLPNYLEPSKEPDSVKSIVLGIFITIILSMIFTTVGWVFYAYKNPNSPSGIWLIEHRPSILVRMISNRFNKESPNLTRLENTVA